MENGTFDRVSTLGHSGASDSRAQTFSILVSGITPALVDGGTLLANLSFWEQGLNQGSPSDNADVQLIFRNGSSAMISSVSSPIIDSHTLAWQNYIQLRHTVRHALDSVHDAFSATPAATWTPTWTTTV